MSSVARLRSVLDHAATILCCTPTYAVHLSEVASREKIDLTGSAIKTIIVAGEPGGSIPTIRARIESSWRGARGGIEARRVSGKSLIAADSRPAV